MRIRRLVFAANVVAVAGCNLLTGASSLDVGEVEPPSPPSDPDTGTPVVNLPESGPVADGGVRDAPNGDARLDAKADVDAGPLQGAKRVFVTSTKSDGNMNGLVSGDQMCASAASAELLGGAWVAWLSIQNATKAVDRLSHSGPWYLVDKMTVAVTSKTQLMAIDGIAHAIDRDEKGNSVPNDEVWTGTRAGEYYQYDCAGWTTVAIFNAGEVGRTNASNGNWTAAAPALCAQQRRVYCFEN